jgi:hypothetical protein
MTNTVENEIAFENRVVDCLSTCRSLIIRKNGRDHRGFIGRRKPDLVTIERDLTIFVWELKSPSECDGNDRESHLWLRHPTPNADYISEERQRHSGDMTIDCKTRGWCVVLDGELRYCLRNYDQPGTWRLPFEYHGVMTKAALAAPTSERESIEGTIQHLQLEGWTISTQSDIVIAKGPL